MKEACNLQSVNRKLSAMNKLLMEENDRLQKQVSQLVCENGYMRHQGTGAPNDGSCKSAVTTPQHSLRDTNSPTGLLSIAEETSEYLSKATGTAVDWVQMPGMKGPPDFLIRMEKELNLSVLALLDVDPCSFKMLAFYGRRLKILKCLGIRPTDINIMAVDESLDRLVFPMNKKDIKTANNLLKDAYVNNRPEWLHELHITLEKKQKIAIESLTSCGVASYVTEVFLPMKLQQEDWT
ncbi:homeobox-leucine zipper protein REVOLUTA-like [Trifolium pratense]|uniref:Homeobox-leucine zipper protein REVOLUTA-like n=1 Tax=Trifolium pratense TaxID=57577 RepID=A0A2K3NMX8_TRIPR|nr:homeobox-leucine zipper protein REVOLUTA-like [Trifolium pratense]